MTAPDQNDPRRKGEIDTGGQPDEEKTDAAQERGERVETGRHIARGGKEQGEVKGGTSDATEDPRSGNT